jgi:hypothetical protein
MDEDRITDHLDMIRREFIKIGGSALAFSLYVGSGVTSFVPCADAGQMKALSDHESRTLLIMARTLFPHDFLADRYYLNIVAAIDAKAAGDDHTLRMVRDGLAALDKTGSPFTHMSEDARANALRGIEQSEFFTFVHAETLTNLYGNPEIWKIFGYEGSSLEHGGYINRGFDDIGWLPGE